MRRILSSLFVVSLVILVILCDLAVKFDTRDVRFNQEKVTFLWNNWTYENEAGKEVEFSLDDKIQFPLEKPFIIKRVFQRGAAAGTYLGFRSSHQEVFISIDGKEIYSFEKNHEAPTLPKSPGSSWNMVRLPQTHKGQELQITFSSSYKNHQEKLESVMLGSKSAIIYQIATEYLPAVFMSMIVLLVSIVFLIYGLYLFKIRHTSSFLYLGLFTLLLGIWFFAESRFIQFISGKVLLSYQMVFLSIALIPIPAILFVGNVLDPKNKRYFYLLGMAAILNFFAMIFAQTMGLVDFYTWVPVSHGIIVVAALLFLQMAVECLRNGSIGENKYLFVGFAVFLLFTLLNIAYFYMSDQYDSAFLVRCGTLLAVMIIAKGELNKNIELIQIGMEAAAYKKAAYTDALTQLGNRLAFDMYLEELSKSDAGESEKNAICVIDVDGLKATNDAYGHWIGDQLICGMAECLRAVFEEKAKCFRIGGEEFAVVMKDGKTALPKCLYQLRNEIIHKNISKQYFLSASWGLAYQRDTKTNSIYEAFQMADVNMYKEKTKKKEIRSERDIGHE